MLTLNDGRSELWQWDTGRALTVDADCSQVHFSNKFFGRSIDVDVIDGTAVIPDILLQTDKDLNVWAFVGTAENGYTKISKTFKVNRRNKPADYVFTPTEQTTIAEIAAIAQSVRDDADAGMFGGTQPDWNQNDSTAADYVKNRPFYTGDPVETVIIPTTTVAFSKKSGLMLAAWPENFDLVDGQTYTISWDNTDYVCTGILFNNVPALGNLAVLGVGENTGEPFLFIKDGGQWTVASTESATEHIIGIKVNDTLIVTLNENYLPKASADGYGVVKKSDIVSAYNFPRNAPHEQMVDAIAAFKTGNASIVWNEDKVIDAYYDSSYDTVSVIFAKTPLVTLRFSNRNGLYVRGLGEATYGELQTERLRIVNKNNDDVYATFSVEGESGNVTLKTMANRISIGGVYGMSETEMILKSSTEGSYKMFKITVDDSGTISATEVI